MVNSLVPKAVLNGDGSIDLTVRIAGFQVDYSVEVSGYATQHSGTFATFSETAKVTPANSPDAFELKVTIPKDKLANLKVGKPITVVTWVSEVWPSVLIEDKDAAAEGIRAWKIDQAAADVWRNNAAADGGEPGDENPPG